jgi:hypothetical protein
VRVGEFSDEPQPDDPLQLACDAALEAISERLSREGIGVDEYSVVITIERGRAMATAVHIEGEHDERGNAVAAFETQLLHAVASARALGLELRVLPMMPGGQG